MHSLAFIAVFVALSLAHGEPLRGLNPDLAVHYSGAGGTFACISGISKIIPFSRVNDDYCDCPDGSDEPGTSACHNGRFYCRNLGHEPRLLASSFVDDGVCDCCDGTDEPKGKCKNTCLQASAAQRESLKEKIADYERVLQTKAGYIIKARSFKEELTLKAETIGNDISKQSAVVEDLKGEVTRLEAEEAAQKAEEARLAAERAAKEAEATAVDAAVSSEGASADSADAEGQLQEDSMEAEREETPEERGRRIASQWTNDPEAAAVPGSEGDVNEDEGEHHEEGSYDGDDNHGDYDRPSGDHLDEEDHQAPEPVYRHSRPPRHTEPATPLGEARRRLHDAERVLRQLQKDKENIDTYLFRKLDFGPEEIFLAFADKCFTSYQTRWTYEVCPFRHATQREGYTNSVSIGRWYGFSEDYKKMYFTGGDECWNVGPRSMTVSMVCGHEEALSDGEEPATCAYTAKLATPALCTDTELEDMKQQLKNLEAFEKEVQAMLAKDEL